MKVFVYGTLKQGHSNHRLLAGATFIGHATTVGPFVLLDCGFPVMTPVGCGAPRVTGEVYEFDDPAILKNLDRLEGEGRMYDRKLIDVVDTDGNEHEVWTYIGCEGALFKRTPLGVQWLHYDKFDFAYARSLADELDDEDQEEAVE